MSIENNNTFNDQNNDSVKKNISLIDSYQAEIKLLRKIISLIPGNVYWKDEDGRFLGCNNNVAKILGLDSPNHIVGKKNEELFDKNLAALTDETDRNVLTNKNTTTDDYIEEQGLDINNIPAIYLSKKLALVDDNGKTIGLLGVSFDITERKQMENALKTAKENAEEANRSKTEFITNLSHDVKTPLAGIIGLAELLTYRLASEELDFAKILLISSRQLLTFFDNCLEVFKLENSNAVPAAENINLKKMVGEICDIFLSTIKNRKLYLNIDYPDSATEVINGNRTGIYRIILNLVSNAIKFTPQGGVTIRIRNEADKLQIIVEDTGIGIPSNKQQAIFDQFTRLIPSYKGTYDGSGIGLYIVHKFVTSMNGTIEVISEPEKGSQFIVTLPLCLSSQQQAGEVIGKLPFKPTTATPENPVQPVAIQTKPSEQSSIRILLVEDNEIVQRIQSSLLNSFGCHVDIAETGEEALDLFQPGKYDLIFMDIGLPDMQGTLTAKLIRKLESASGEYVPIIALTAHISDNAALHAEFGISDTMQKPLSREQAKEIIDQYVVKLRRLQKKSQHLELVKKMWII